MIGFYDYTVLATYAATALGVTGMFQAVEGRHLTAVFCLLAAGLLDCFDGRIARTKKDRSHQQQSFGIQIDSLNDVLCFGALPSVAGYCAWSRWSDAPTPVWYGAALCVFTLAGLIRLAYFNVTEEERQQTEGGGRKCYLGLPITASALVFPLFYLLGLLLPGGPYMAGYYAGKAYVASLTRGVAEELRQMHSPVYVCALCPGPVDTEFNDRAGVIFALKGITPEFCVDEALLGMMRHKTIIVPSAFMRLCTSVQKLVPTPLLMPIVARQQKKKLG